jgi:hypothetical protein
MAQQDFAEFCELNLLTFSSPDPATILEIAQTFQAKSTVDFSSLELGVIPMRPRLGAAIASDRSDSYGELPQSLNPTMRPRVCTVIASDKTSA